MLNFDIPCSVFRVQYSIFLYFLPPQYFDVLNNLFTFIHIFGNKFYSVI
jgi:hypothetical protein